MDMKDLSLHLLDVAQNSLRAGAKHLRIALDEREGHIRMTVEDDGEGMPQSILAHATEPFFSTKETEGAGLGLYLLLRTAERTGGSLHLASRDRERYPTSHGTTLTAELISTHIDCPPMGDTVATLLALLQGSPEVELHFSHAFATRTVTLDTRELRAILGTGVPLSTPEVLRWIGEYLTEQYQ